MSSVNQQSFNELRSTLIRRGIPPRYAHRVTAELDDHAHDLATNGDNPANSLGDLSHLADEISTTFRQRTFAGRHPWLVFALLPLPLAILTYIAVLIGYVGMIQTLMFSSQGAVTVADFIAKAMLVLSLPVSCAWVSWLICRNARRAGLTWKHAALACLPVLAFAFTTFSEFRLSPTAHSDGVFMFALPVLFGDLLFHGWQQMLQALVPLLVIGGMMAREARKQIPALVTDTA